MGRLIACVACAWLLSGCANLNSVFRDRTMLYEGATGVANVVTVDAKQRAIISSSQPDPGNAGARIARICAEPPPDIMSTINSSLTAALSGSLSPSDRSAALNVASAMVEQAAEIQRSQSMNLLALSMYRTCERFLNGAIREEAASDQAQRDQHTMVTVLAIEQLTNLGRNTSQGATLASGQSGASAGAGAAAAIGVLDKAKAAADASAQAYGVASKTLADALASASPPTGKSATCDDVASDKQADCRKARTQADDAKAASTRDETYYQAQLKLAGAAGNGVQSSAAGGSATASQRGGSVALSDTAIKTISDAVLDLARLGVAEDPLASLCASAMRSHAISSGNFQAIADECDAASKLAGKTGVATAMDLAGMRLLGADSSSMPRLYIQVATDAQVDSVQAINAALHRSMPEIGLRPYQVVGPDEVPKQSDIRYFNASDAAAAGALSRRLGKAFGGRGPACNRRSSKVVKPGLLELWIAKDAKIDVSALGDASGQPGASCP